MNATTILVGIASGAASAALSVALGAGSFLSAFLFLFAPLPVFIAALGWRHHAGFIATIVGTLLLYLFMGFETARGYGLSVGLPGWWLAYLALLGQPTDQTQPEKGLAWYPVGRLVVWTAVIGAALVLLTVLLHGGSVEEYRASLRTTFENFLRAETGAAPGSTISIPNGGDVTRITEIAVMALPPLAAAVWTTIALVNLWLAGRIVRASGRMPRHWPDLSAFNLPGLALFAFVGGIAGSALPGLAGFSAGVVASSFAIAFAALGLALLHTGTRGRPGRLIMLTAAYFLMAVQTWLVLVVAILGVFEFLFGLRARIAAVRQPPPKPVK